MSGQNTPPLGFNHQNFSQSAQNGAPGPENDDVSSLSPTGSDSGSPMAIFNLSQSQGKVCPICTFTNAANANSCDVCGTGI